LGSRVYRKIKGKGIVSAIIPDESFAILRPFEPIYLSGKLFGFIQKTPENLSSPAKENCYKAMADTGHAKNVANFETIIIILVGLGAVYNPAQALIMLAALQIVLTAAKDAIAAVKAAEAAETIAVDEREAEFEGIGKLAVRAKQAAEVDVNDAAFTADLTSITRKFYGGKAGGKSEAKPVEGEPPPETHSVSQRSYDSLIAHFASLIALLKTRSEYKTTDAEVSINALEAKLARLEAVNNAAKASIAASGNAQDARDEILYNPETGVLKRVLLIKKQIGRIPGKASAAYQQINALQFRRVK
jgi:hypothetical protein